jgi:hypothetical protein
VIAWNSAWVCAFWTNPHRFLTHIAEGRCTTRDHGGVMTRTISLLFGFMASIALPCAAGAQNPQPAAPHETHPPVAPPNASQPPPEQIAPGGSASATPDKDNLSDRLAKQHGMLQPPKVDPGIQAPLPSHAQGTMPVIPPPGTPGGNQTVVPK